MILTRILGFLERRQVASLAEIAQAVGSTPDAVRNMLQTLQRKGLVHPYQPQGGCGSRCRQCAQGSAELYAHGAAPVQAVDVTQCGLIARDH
ncbi:MAG TPA: FeoC-like transcriptional regulator [Gammaproteobacteria bacterium]|nr:FeoC-like transcriptional regulator [Gammaproteobacteria bacterium]